MDTATVPYYGCGYGYGYRPYYGGGYGYGYYRHGRVSTSARGSTGTEGGPA